MGALYWNPDPEMFHLDLPFLHRGILWYGFFFAAGFFIGYWIFLYVIRRHLLSLCKEDSASLKKRSVQITEKVTLYVVIGTLAGARLVDLLFYQGWAQIARDPLSLFKIWEGGLASHGGVIGGFIALWILSKRIHFSYLRLMDLIVIPTSMAAVCIRIGNFFNQEILGIPSDLPWAITFGAPLGADQIVPRHPVQLYEALWYLIVFFVLLAYFKQHPRLEKPGRITGLFLILVFTFRFCIEFLKVEQSRLIHGPALLTMGQWLSIPLVLLGIYLYWGSKNRLSSTK